MILSHAAALLVGAVTGICVRQLSRRESDRVKELVELRESLFPTALALLLQRPAQKGQQQPADTTKPSVFDRPPLAPPAPYIKGNNDDKP